jgi:flagellin
VAWQLKFATQEQNYMALSVLNNIAAIYAQNNLNLSQNSLQKTLTQLSSGSRINSGADDAAGLALADGLHANVAALSQSTQNAADGIGLLQTADGALSQVTNLLNRAVTLATQSANGTLNSNQVSSANQEYQNILSQISNIGSTTNFNGNSVFSSTAKTVFISDGTSSGATTYNAAIGALTASSVGVSAPSTGVTSALVNPTPTGSTTTVGGVAKFAALGAASNTISGTISVSVAGGAAETATIAAGTTLAAAVTQLNTQYTAGSTGLVASVGTGSDANKLIITGPKDPTTTGGNTLSLAGTTLSQKTADGTTAGAGVDFSSGATVNVSSLTAGSATTVLTSVTTAIGNVAYQRGIIGAEINQLQAASNVAASESENLTSAESSIRSTNYGAATSDLAKFKVLSQTGISALAQANAVQQDVLKLLQ